MKYLNLNLEAFEYRKENNIERFRVRVTNSPAGEQKPGEAETVSLPEDLRSRLRRLEKRALTLEQIITLGEDLGATLFPARVRALYVRSLARMGEAEGLRIRLMIDPYVLSDIPWEYVYLSDDDTPASQKGANGFLVFNPQISLVRYQMIGHALGKIETVGEENLRMVALFSNPDNTPGLDLGREEQNIRQALKELPQIQPEFYPNVTIEKLLKILIKTAHIFHFSGHGSFHGSMGDALGSEGGEGTLALTDEAGHAVDFPARKLAMNLAGRGVRFAMLGACESSKVDQINAWTGIAPALTLAGIPAVVGMQFKVRDPNAIAFSNILYDSLAAGLTIDEAVAKGRLAIYTLGDPDERDWGVPVLYLRADEGVLFPRAVTGVAPRDETPRADRDIADVIGKIRDELKRDPEYCYLLRRFLVILEQISSLSDYKALHDGLHEIQYSYYQNIIRNTKIVMDDKYAKYDLFKYLRDYRRVVSEMKKATGRKKVDPVEDQWVSLLDQAGNDLEEGINKVVKNQIDGATQTINQVIGTQPTIVNRKLYNAVYAYNGSLPELRQVMNEVREKFNAIAPAETAKFQKGITSLKELNTKLSELIAEHNTWQDMDTQLRILPDLLDAGVPVFNNRWQNQRTRIAPFYTSSEDPSSVLYKSSVLLKGADDLLQAAILGNDPGDVRMAFENYCSQASDRFFYVDKSVMELCEKLSLIRNELD